MFPLWSRNIEREREKKNDSIFKIELIMEWKKNMDIENIDIIDILKKKNERFIHNEQQQQQKSKHYFSHKESLVVVVVVVIVCC